MGIVIIIYIVYICFLVAFVIHWAATIINSKKNQHYGKR